MTDKSVREVIAENVVNITKRFVQVLNAQGDEPKFIPIAEADSILSALKEAGFAVVPRDPTPLIGQAIYAAWDSFGEDAVMGPEEAIAIYRAAVLTASQQQGRG